VTLTLLDWSIIVAYFAVSLAIGLLYSRRAGRSVNEFFLSGLWGVVVTDFFQFILAMGGTIALAWFVVRLPAVGGIAGLHDKLPASTFEFLPRVGGPAGSADGAAVLALPLAAFLAYVGIQWWASWYPGQEPGGGGYVAQRMMSAKDERHSLLATLWFTVAHYCVRPWPWILVGLASIVLYPGLADKESGYVLVIRDYLPAGWRGLLLASFFAAYMSTIATQFNWGSSYLVNDFYRRVRPGGPGWNRVAARAGGPPPESLRGLIGVWVGGWVLVYATLFGTGTLILYSFHAALPHFAAAAAGASFVIWGLQRRGSRSVVE
jgi:Na+/proline symporter